MADHQKAQNVKPTKEAAHQRRAVEPVSQEWIGLQPVELTTLQRAVANPSRARPADILNLQRAYGNRAVSRLIQAKLMVGPVGDKYEREADRVAEQVINMPAPASVVSRQPEEKEVQTKPLAASITPLVQRQAEEEEELQTKLLVQRQAEEEEEEVQTKPLVQRQAEEEEEEEVQTKPLLQRQAEEEEEEVQAKPLVQRRGDGSVEARPSLESRLVAQKGRGSPLPDETRAFMEPRFGADFSGVRVHTDGEAAQLSRQLSARAFTHGQDIYLGAGKYDPGADAGKRLLAHELTHVVQQTRSGGQKVSASRLGPELVQRERELATWDEESKITKKRVGVALVELEASDGTPNDRGYLTPPTDFTYRQQGAVDKLTELGFDISGVNQDRLYIRWPAARLGTKSAPPVTALTPQETLYGPNEGGQAQGSFEYVANYLFVEVWRSNEKEAKEIWNKFIHREAGQSTKRRDKDFSDNQKYELLNEMIALGMQEVQPNKLAADINKELEELATTKGQGARRLQIQEMATGMEGTKWLKAWLLSWMDWSNVLPPVVGIGFHCTDKPATVVTGAKGAEAGGETAWGGLQRPGTVQRKIEEYALNQSWNPLGNLVKKGVQLVRKGNKDNELLTTISIATVVRDSLKFPLARPYNATLNNATGKFEMTAYLYSVMVRQAFGTGAYQVKKGVVNPFAEVAVHGIPPEDFILTAEVKRQHDVGAETAEGKQTPLDSSFKFQIMNVEPLAAGKSFQAIFAKVKELVEDENGNPTFKPTE